MPSAYNKFNVFTFDLVSGNHDFDAHTFKYMLSNVAPVATNSIKTDITDITPASGYAAGGPATVITTSTATGVAKVVTTDIVVTAGAALGPFRYVVIYNDTTAAPVKPLIAWWDYGSALSLAIGETFTIDSDQANGIFTNT